MQIYKTYMNWVDVAVNSAQRMEYLAHKTKMVRTFEDKHEFWSFLNRGSLLKFTKQIRRRCTFVMLPMQAKKENM